MQDPMTWCEPRGPGYHCQDLVRLYPTLQTSFKEQNTHHLTDVLQKKCSEHKHVCNSEHLTCFYSLRNILEFVAKSSTKGTHKKTLYQNESTSKVRYRWSKNDHHLWLLEHRLRLSARMDTLHRAFLYYLILFFFNPSSLAFLTLFRCFYCLPT